MQLRFEHSLAVALLTLIGCTSAPPTLPTAEPTAQPQPIAAGQRAERGQSGRGSSRCPTALRGTVVFATPLDDGAAVVFIAPPGPKVEELRRRVRSLARSPGKAPAPLAAVDDVESGARLKLTARRPEELGDVQTNVFEHAQRLVGATCPLMRDELAHPARTGVGADSTIMPVPPGIIPGVGMLGPTGVPSTGPTF